VKQEKVHEFTLKQMNWYYFDKLLEYQLITGFKDELKLPRIYMMEKTLKDLRDM
jgi:hypothetical protein